MDDYPDKKTLRRIEQWSVTDAPRCLEFIARKWSTRYGSVTQKLRADESAILNAFEGEHFWRFATGGWSGNESLIYALRGTAVHALTWWLSMRGGLHIYRIPH